MPEPPTILAINPGSTSTRVALFRGRERVAEGTLERPEAPADDAWHDYGARVEAILSWLRRETSDPPDAVVGRGGLLRPMPGGTYRVDPAMIADARAGRRGAHPSNVGCALADAVASEAGGVPAFVVDPVSVDEFEEPAYFSGLPTIRRRSLSHALNIHAVARSVALERGWDPGGRNLVVAHLGGGISVCPVRGGRIVDANDANSGGPFSPTRAGGLPTQQLIDLCFSGDFNGDDLRRLTLREAGLRGYLGTADAREVERRIEAGEAEALAVYRAMAYQIAKEVGAMATVLHGGVDLIVLTGGLAGSELLTGWIRDRVAFIAPVEVVPEVEEMEALRDGALRVLEGGETPLPYGGGGAA